MGIDSAQPSNQFAETPDPKPHEVVGGEQQLVLADEHPTQADAEAAGKEAVPSLQLPAARPGGAPAWVVLPPNLKFPRGRQVGFIRFEAQWTDSPQKGDRQCIIWGLSDIDEKVAFTRAMSDPNRAAAELAKQMVRAIDGYQVDWSGTPGPACIDEWWREIGGKCRQMLIRIYAQTHVLPEEDRKRFFESCIEFRTTG